MANEEQLAILKQGVAVWNKWRDDHPDARIDLTHTGLQGTNLTQANLREADLSRSNLDQVVLSNASLVKAIFEGAFVDEADLDGADLGEADIHNTWFHGNVLIGASLKGANLSGANMSVCDFREADLGGAKMHGTNLLETYVGNTIFRNIDLSTVQGLHDIYHISPSSISMDTFMLSKGNIPEVFLRGCGLRDWEIEMVKLYDPELGNEERNKIMYRVYDLQANQALQISPLFISYSRSDDKFVDKLGDTLNAKGIRYWRDIHEMKAGRLETQIDQAIRQNPTVLLVLSKNSLSSDWVEHEVRTARSLEKEMSRDVLCPVALDDSWKDSRWPRRLMEQIMEYNILDFSDWQDDSKFDGTFRKLIDGLELFYKK